MRLLRRAQTIYREGGIRLFLKYTRRYIFKTILRDMILASLVRFLREVLTVVISPKPGLVLFGFTDEVGGNSGLVYEWFLEQDTDDVTPAWMTSSKELYKTLSEQGQPVLYRRSLRGQLAILRAEVMCYDGLYRHSLPERPTKIKIRHEIPVKDGPEAAKEAATATDVPRHDYVVTTGSFLAEKQFEYHRVRKGGGQVRRDQFLPLGFPRNDQLFDVPTSVREGWDSFLGGESYETVVLYAPTRRRHHEYETDNVDLFPFDDFELDRLSSILERHDALLLLRLHPSDARAVSGDNEIYETRHEHETLQEFVDKLCSLDRVRSAAAFGDTNEVLQFTDILLTDYSTVYHTFLLLDRPILFFPYDYEEFQSSFGFKYDYDGLCPGPAIDSFDEFCGYLDELAAGTDPHQGQRHTLRDRIHDYPDGNATERIAEYIRGCCSIP